MEEGAEVGAARAVRSAWQRERARASHRLHQSVGQSLTVLGLELDLLAQDIAGADPGWAERVRQVQATLERTFEEIRTLSRELNPEQARRFGIVEALEGLGARLEEQSAATLEVRWTCDAGQADPGLFDGAALAAEMLAERGPGAPLELRVGTGEWQLRSGVEWPPGFCWGALGEALDCELGVTPGAPGCTILTIRPRCPIGLRETAPAGPGSGPAMPATRRERR